MRSGTAELESFPRPESQLEVLPTTFHMGKYKLQESTFDRCHASRRKRGWRDATS